MGSTETLIAWIQNKTEIKRKLSKSGKIDSTLGQYFHINMWKTKIRLIFSCSLLVMLIKNSRVSGLGVLV